MRKKMIYLFQEADSNERELLGGKGAGLALMAKMGLRVSEGCIITTNECVAFYERKEQWPEGLIEELWETIADLERSTGRFLGDEHNPLFVAVRSGAAISMPGMMETILNLGLNDQTVLALAKQSGSAQFAYDCYCRFIQMYSTVVFDLEKREFNEVLNAALQKEGVAHSIELSTKGLQSVMSGYKKILQKADRVFPQNVCEQLVQAITAVFRSWNTDRAIFYREENGISDAAGTAVVIQRMVFGNLGNNSATGVLFTRDSITGARQLTGDILQKAQGEAVVDGSSITASLCKTEDSNGTSLEELMPEVYAELQRKCDEMELCHKDMVEMEFTIEQGKLYFLQVRIGKRSGAAAVRIAVEMANEGLITRKEAILRITEHDLNNMLHSVLNPGSAPVLTTGLPASPGAAVGQLVFTAEDAVYWKQEGKNVLLVRNETSPEDIRGMAAAQGIITATGGPSSHAAVVGRGMGKPCIVSCKNIVVDERAKTLSINGTLFYEGDTLSFDGGTGMLYKGTIEQIEPVMTKEFYTILKWCQHYSVMDVYANAETPHDALVARQFGATGIGLARIEHMAFGEDRLHIMQRMILNMSDDEIRHECLLQLETFFIEDFIQLFNTFAGLPVTVRLMDPPLNEFIQSDEDLEAAGYEEGMLASLKAKRAALHEHNPMMGHRGCRLGISYPDLYEMQVRAIFKAALAAEKAKPEIMIPLIIDAKEMAIFKDMINDIAMTMGMEVGSYTVGTMIETPRAAIVAADIAQYSQFFSFGTNDLTQFSCGISRDDGGSFLDAYVKRGILKANPFVTIDIDGVGQLVKFAVLQARADNPDLKIGVCGEHGGDYESVRFFDTLKLTYVSCSPYRVPIAQLAASQASLARMPAGLIAV